MVCETEKPSLRDASCCKVEVVKGGAGDFFAGFFSMLSILNCAFLHASRKASASAFLSNRCGNSAFSSTGAPVASTDVKTAVTL